MKRWMVLLLAAVLALGCAAAYAYTEDAYGAQNTPQEIREYIAGSRWADWAITGWVNPGTYKINSASAFVAVKKGRANDLLAFRFDHEKGRYVYAWHNAAALPQVEEPIELGLYGDAGGQPRFKSCFVVGGEIEEAACFWAQDENGVWNIQNVWVYDMPALMFIDASRDGVLHMSNVGWVDGKGTDTRIYGEYQRDLRYFSFNAFPRTVKQAREKLSNPPEIPDGTLEAKRVKFASGKKYAVYQGPGEEYGRAANGKASVSTNDWIQVFGEENGYVMIQYDISSDRMRIGWIEASSLPKNADVDELRFAPVRAHTTGQARMTDDPLHSQTEIAVIASGSEVLWLATMGDWAYVEADEGAPLRGFVRRNLLTTQRSVQ